jgi:multimeric flavodoxin WrbA
MAKKVLIISSSPRKGGNSDLLCDEFMKGAIEAGNEVEKIFLKDKTVHPCTGCSVCTVNLVRRRMMQWKSWRR